MDNSEVLSLMHLGGYRVRRPELLVNANLQALKSDLKSDLPSFVFVYDKALAKEYLFNFFAYLEYLGCDVYWEHQLKDQSILERSVILIPENLINTPQYVTYKHYKVVPLYPDQNGKKAIFKQVSPLITGLQKIPHVNTTNAFIWLENPEGEDKWLFNVAGFLSYVGIKVAWGKPSVNTKALLYIGHEKIEGIDFIDIGTSDVEQAKRLVFSELLENKYIEKEEVGFKIGQALANLSTENNM